ncbi:MAG: hypothetical protein ACU85V_12505 [Gammaproteobacteria bacterium]
MYLAALALLVIGTFGLFGQDRDPLSGIFLMPLGLPWVNWIDGVSDNLKPWLAILAPALNVAILASACSFLSRSQASHE